MCYSETSSAVVFVVSTMILAAIVCVRKYTYDRFLVGFAMTIIAMQAVEFLIWRAIATQHQMLNLRATQVAAVLLLLQPASLVWLGYIYQLTRIPPNVMYAASMVYVVYVAIGLLQVLGPPANLKLTQKNGSHLAWGFPAYGPLRTWLYFLPPLLILPLLKNTAYGVVIFLTLAVTLLLGKYKAVLPGSASAWRSLWCFFLNILPWVILVGGFLLDHPVDDGECA